MTHWRFILLLFHVLDGDGACTRAVQCLISGGHFGFVWLTARTMRHTPMGMGRTCGEPYEIKENTHRKNDTALDAI